MTREELIEQIVENYIRAAVAGAKISHNFKMAAVNKAANMAGFKTKPRGSVLGYSMGNKIVGRHDGS